MFPTRQAPPAPPADARIDDQDRAGPDGEDQINSIEGQGRRWYHLRPKPRRSSDLWGFNSTWWMVLGWPLLIVFALSPGPWW
jgi:hypothetical protein